MDVKQTRIANELKQMEIDIREAADAVSALAKVMVDAATTSEIDHAYLVRHSTAIEIAAKRACTGIAAWRKHL